MLIDRRLARAAWRAWPWLLCGLLARLIGLAASMALAFAIGGLVADPAAVGALTAAGLAVVVRVGVGPVADVCAIRGGAAAREQLRGRAIAAAVRRETDGSMPGTDAAILAVTGIENLESYFARYVPQLAYAICAPALVLVIVAIHSPATALLMLAVAPVTFLLIALLLSVAGRRAGGHFDSYGALARFFLESVRGLPTLVLFGRDGDRAEAFEAKTEQFRVITMRVLRMQLSSIVVMDLAAYGGAAIAAASIVGAASDGIVPIGPALALVLLLSEFFLPVRQLGGAFHVAMLGAGASRRLFAFLDESGEEPGEVLSERPGGQASADGVVRLRSVSFRYPGEQRDVLHEVSVEIGTGVTAIVGASGSGKSTLASLIAGLRVPTSGEVSAPAVAMVAQSSYVFGPTIADDLRLARPEAGDRELLSACHTVRLDQIVPDASSLARAVGEGGGALSGGQRQKLACARALVQRRPVLLFDEATSNIDAESEDDLHAAFRDLAETRPVIVITHRTSDLSWADRVLRVGDGRISEATGAIR